MFTLPNEPQGIGRILDNGFRLFKAGIKGALGIMLIMIGSTIVLSIVLSLVMGAAGSLFMGAGSFDQPPHFGLGAILIMLIISIASALFFTYFYVALILNYANVAYQKNTDIGNALSGAFPRLLSAVGATLIVVVFLFLLLIPTFAYELSVMHKLAAGEASFVMTQIVQFVLQIPYYLFAITLSFTIYRVVIDNYGPVSAVIGSHKLVWGHFWRTTLWLLIIYLIVAVLFLAVFTPLFGGAFMSGQGGMPNISPSAAIIGVLAMLILMMFLFPFIIAMTIPYYHDLKLRKEGADLADRIMAA